MTVCDNPVKMIPMGNFVSTIPFNEIDKFCQRWKICELAIFGSALREDFDSDSDIDILVAFAPEAEWGLLDHMQMQQELQRLFQRNIDLISKRALERSSNWLRREEILKTAQVLYSEHEAIHATG
jgi:predicted nucleotidyltransferase